MIVCYRVKNCLYRALASSSSFLFNFEHLFHFRGLSLRLLGLRLKEVVILNLVCLVQQEIDNLRLRLSGLGQWIGGLPNNIVNILNIICAPFLQMESVGLVDEGLEVGDFDDLAASLVVLDERVHLRLRLALLGQQALHLFIVEQVVLVHAEYFKCLRFRHEPPADSEPDVSHLLA